MLTGWEPCPRASRKQMVEEVNLFLNSRLCSAFQWQSQLGKRDAVAQHGKVGPEHRGRRSEFIDLHKQVAG